MFNGLKGQKPKSCGFWEHAQNTGAYSYLLPGITYIAAEGCLTFQDALSEAFVTFAKHARNTGTVLFFAKWHQKSTNFSNDNMSVLRQVVGLASRKLRV